MKSFNTSDDLKLAYTDEGRGVPVLCLAGLTRNSTDFDDLAAQTGDNIRLIRMDYRGRGKSDYDPNYSNYAIPVEARDEEFEEAEAALGIVAGRLAPAMVE